MRTGPNLLEVIVCYFDVEIREVPLRGNALGLQPSDLRGIQTIGVVATLGVTLTGTPVSGGGLPAELDATEPHLGLDIPIQARTPLVGGFAPRPLSKKSLTPGDFAIERVKSINASGHKYGLG